MLYPKLPLQIKAYLKGEIDTLVKTLLNGKPLAWYGSAF